MSFFAFQLTAVGRVAKQPEVQTKGDNTYCHLTLIGNDYAGPGKEPVATTLFLVAFGKTADVLAKNARKGDQLIVSGHIRNNNYRNGEETKYGLSYIVDDFTWGAPGAEKRAELAQRSRTHDNPDDDRDNDIPF